jgi:hypothetical protein
VRTVRKTPETGSALPSRAPRNRRRRRQSSTGWVQWRPRASLR